MVILGGGNPCWVHWRSDAARARYQLWTLVSVSGSFCSNVSSRYPPPIIRVVATPEVSMFFLFGDSSRRWLSTCGLRVFEGLPLSISAGTGSEIFQNVCVWAWKLSYRTSPAGGGGYISILAPAAFNNDGLWRRQPGAVSTQVDGSWKNPPLFFSFGLWYLFLEIAHSGKLAPGELPGFSHLHDSPLPRGGEM